MDRVRTGLRFLCILLCVQLLVPGIPAANMMFRFNAARTGDYSPAAGVTGTAVSELWNYTATARFVRSTPAVADGMVYAGCYDSYVYAIYANNGTMRWRFRTGGVVPSSPAIVNNVVYVGSFDHKVSALFANNGTMKWNYS